MPAISSRLSAGVLVTATLLVSCGSSSGGSSTPGSDASADGTREDSAADSSNPGDGGSEDATDASRDVTSDVPSDVASDTPEDAPSDAGPDTSGQSESGVDASIAVTGTVIDSTGAPFAGCKVAIAGATATTAADGSFTLSATAPYDLEIATPDGTGVVVLGLTRPDPTLVLPDVASPLSEGTLQGSVPPTMANQWSGVFFVPTNNPVTSYVPFYLQTGPASSYSLSNVAWWAPKDIVGTLYLFEFTNGTTTTADSFLGYAQVPNTTLSAGQTATVNFPATLSSVTNGNLSVNMSVPSGYSRGAGHADMQMPGSPGWLLINQSLATTTSFSLPVPVISGATYSVIASASTPSSVEYTVVRTAATVGGTANVTVTPAAALSAPQDGATGVSTGTTFSWTGATGTSILTLNPVPNDAGTTSAPYVYVIGAASSMTLPDLSPVGLTLGSATAYTWQVQNWPELATPDDYASATPLVDFFCNEITLLGGTEAACTYSATRGFTTQ